MSEPIKTSIYKQFLRKLVPALLLKERGIYLRLGSKAGRQYTRLRLMDLLKIRRPGTIVPRNSQSFLFVCFGNIMRSPMAEALFKREMQLHRTEWKFASAGLHATPAKPAHPNALAAATAFGVALDGHRAQLVTPELMEETDVIFAMDFQNLAELITAYPSARQKVFMLSSFLDGPERNRAIPDPYFGDLQTTRDCYKTLQLCIRNLSAHLLTIK